MQPLEPHLASLLGLSRGAGCFCRVCVLVFRAETNRKPGGGIWVEGGGAGANADIDAPPYPRCPALLHRSFFYVSLMCAGALS